MVCFAGGMSRWRVISPAIRLSATIAFLALLMNLWVQPAAYREMRQELFEVRTDLAATLVRQGEFTEPTPGLTVYAQHVDPQGEMDNLFIYQLKGDGSSTIYMAAHGRISQRRGEPVLILKNGSTQEFSSHGVLNYLTYNEYPFELKALSNSDELIHYKPSDRYLHELFFPDLQQDWEKRNQLGLLAEGHSRLASPLYNITFMALALSAIIGGGFSRLGYGRRIAVMAAVAVTVRILGFVAQSASEESAWLNVLQYAVPLVTIALALKGVFRRPVSRRRAPRRAPGRVAVAGV